MQFKPVTQHCRATIDFIDSSYRTTTENPDLLDHSSTMNPRMTKAQQVALFSQLGNMSPQLLYKASVHGYTAAAFHQRCDDQGATLSVGYNDSSFIFGGYTSISFNDSGAFGNDPEAFVFSFNRGKFVKYQVNNPTFAVLMHDIHGPYFGDNLGLCVNGEAKVFSSPSQDYYNFNAEEMHGNDLQLVECEVYKIEDVSAERKLLEKPDSSKLLPKPDSSKLLPKPWRNMVWTAEKRIELMGQIQNYEPTMQSLEQVRVLLIGPVGAGKSSLFNSIKSVFAGHVTNQAMTGGHGTSLTTQFRTYNFKKGGKEGKLLPITLCDTMGLEETTGDGLNVDDISNMLRGHIKDRQQLNSAVPLQPEDQDYQETTDLKDKIHCVAYVIEAKTIAIMPPKLEEKLNAIRKMVNLIGIPQLVLLTKVDEACPLVEEDLTNVYRSPYIKTKLQEASQRLGIPLSCVVPVRNYTNQQEVDENCDILLLSAVIQMLRFADDYFDEVGDTVTD